MYVTVNRTVHHPSFEKWWTPLLCVDVSPSQKSHFQATWSFDVAPSCHSLPDDGVVVGVVTYGVGNTLPSIATRML